MFGWKSIYTFAWDFAEQGIDTSTAEFKALGLNTVTFAGSYHSGKFLRPRSSSPVVFPEDGTVYFHHDPSLYGKIKPIPNSILDSRDILSELVRKSETAVNVWLVLLHNTKQGERNPKDCVTNAFGDRYIYNLCPSSPHSRDYAIGLASDVSTNYPIVGVSIESPGFTPFVHGFHHEFNLVQPNQWLENLLGICFCDHCLKGAAENGIDANRLQARVRSWIQDYLDSEIDYPKDMAESFWLADIATDSELMAFMTWRCQVVTSLVSEIRAAVASQVTVAVIPSVGRPTANAWYEGSKLVDLKEAAGHLEICLYEPNSLRAVADLEDVCRRLGTIDGLRCIIRPSAPDLNTASEVRSTVSLIASKGVDGISFYNWGFLRKYNLRYIYESLKALDT